MRRLPVPLFLLAILVGGAPAQRTWVVDQLQRPGTDFVAIQPAVQAAAVGDIVLVRPTGTAYAGASISKGLALLGDGQVELNTDLQIRNLPAGQHVSVKLFRMWEGTATAGGRPISCTDCAGTVHFERVVAPGSTRGPGLSADNCTHVSAVDCRFDGGATMYILTPVFRFGTPREGVACRGSALLLMRCHGAGASIYQPPSGTFLGSTACIVAHTSRMVLVDCMLAGGDSPCPPFPSLCLAPHVPSPALALNSGCSVVTKGSAFTGGVYQNGWCSCTDAPGVLADAASRIVSDPGTTFTRSGGQLLQQAIVDLQSAGAAPGNTIALTLRSRVSAQYLTFASFPDSYVLSPIGVWLDPRQAVLVFSGTFTQGRTDWLALPPWLPRGLAASFQSVLFVNGALELSTPAVVVLH